jgi:hypothetical protein
MKSFKLLLPILFLIFAGCPAPSYPILFGYNGKWQKSLKIEDNSIRIRVNGHLKPSGLENYLDLDIEIIGLDDSRIEFYDTTNVIGQGTKRTHYFDDKVIIESDSFHFPSPWIYIWKDKVDVTIGGETKYFHKSYYDMTRDELLAYLNTLTARIRIEKIFNLPKIIEVKVDKELLARKLGK